MLDRRILASCVVLLSASVAQAAEKPATIIQVTANFTSPDELKNVASAFAMARRSAEAGRETILFFNSSAAKLGTSLLPSSVKLPGDLSISDELSKLTGKGVQIFVSADEAKQEGIEKGDLRKGVSLMSLKQLFNKIDGQTVVFSY